MIAVDTSSVPQRLDDMTFPDAAPAYHQEIGAPTDEVSCGQFFDLHSIEGLWVEVPVEPFQGLIVSETGLADATLDGTLSPRAGFGAQQEIEKTQVRQVLSFCSCEQFIQSLGLNWDPEGREIAQAAITQ